MVSGPPGRLRPIFDPIRYEFDTNLFCRGQVRHYIDTISYHDGVMIRAGILSSTELQPVFLEGLLKVQDEGMLLRWFCEFGGVRVLFWIKVLVEGPDFKL